MRRLIYIMLGLFDRLLGRVNPVVILCYHSIGNSWKFSVSKSEFEYQMNAIKNTHTAVSLADVVDYVKGKKIFKTPVFAVTFDDGYKDILAVTDFCRSQQIKPTVFALATPQKANYTTLANTLPLLSKIDLTVRIAESWEVGCHTATHAPLHTLVGDDLMQEVHGAKQILERTLGTKVRGFCYPNGKYNRDVLGAVAAAGYSYAVTMDDGIITQNTDLLRIPRVGVDGSHDRAEFPYLWSPSVVQFRKIIKNSFLGRYL